MGPLKIRFYDGAELLNSNPHLHMPYAKNLNQAHDQLHEFVERVGIEIELMKVAKELEG